MSQKAQRKVSGKQSALQESTTAHEQLPGLDGTTLSKLTKKLEEKLRHSKTTQNKNKQTEKSKPTLKKSPQDSTSQAKGNAPRGEKRDSAGKVVNYQNYQGKQPTSAGQEKEQNELRREIELLGGTKDDYDLVNGVESGSEIEGQVVKKSQGPRKVEKHGDSFDRELSSILKEFSHAPRDDSENEDSNDAKESVVNNMDVDDVQAESRASTRTPSILDHSLAKRTPGTSKMILSLKPAWLSFSTDPPQASAQNFRAPPAVVVQALHSHAKDMLDAENEAFQRMQQSSSTSSSKFYTQVMTSGTLTDKVSALTLAVQESPLHNMKALETLLILAGKRSRAQAIEVLRALKDLFAQGTLLPSDRRLRLFGQQPSLLVAIQNARLWTRSDPLPKGLTGQALMEWAYEDWLKETYFDILKILETWCNDELEFAKARATSYVYELLKEKPEQESNLLRILVNKLGDPVKKIASRTSYLLLQLESAHPAMKETIISAIESDLLLRPNQSLHTCYYAVITLNQTVLSNREESVPQKLLAVYFRLFVTLLNPVAINSRSTKSKKTDKRPQGKSRGKKASKESREQIQEDELREKVVSAILTGVNRAYPFAGADSSNLGDHMDTLFKITHSSNFNTSIQAMMLIQQLSSAHQVASDRFYRTLYESLLDPRLTASSKPALYINLLYKSLKADLDIKRVKAFAKRILQTLTLQQPSFICGTMYLLHELEVTFPSLAIMIDEPEDHDTGVEVFRDQDNADDVDQGVVNQTPSKIYDSRKRDPKHSHAENGCLWELVPFLTHFHPSVSVGAEHLLNHKALSGKPDLNLHTLSHFLDRFVYRNPKLSSQSTTRGSSMMQPMAGSDSSALLVGGKAHPQELPVNAEAFQAEKEGETRPEDAFFHQYFNSLGKEKTKAKEKREQQKKEKEKGKRDTGEEDEEEEIWDAMMHSGPDLEGDIDSGGEDLEMRDLDSDFSESEGHIGEDEALEDLGDNESITDGSAASPGFDDEDDEDEKADNREERPSSSQKTAKAKRRKLKSLPTFASAEEYADMVDDEEGED